MALKLKNLSASRLAQNVSSVGIFITVTDGDAFPTINEPGEWFPLALVNDLAQTEFVRCIERDGNTLRVERHQEGSVSRPYSAGDVVELRLTLAALEELRDVGSIP